MHSDVLVVGGGPAGLSAAIAARAKGLSVTLIDARHSPIDKPCGEGLLPEGVAALRSLGVDLDQTASFRFAGINFKDDASSAAAQFGGASAYGIRRTVLHQALVDRAQAVGVSLLWNARVAKQDSNQAEIDGRPISFRWLIAADGLKSGIRRRVGLDSRYPVRGRFAFRRHYAIQPWTDLVEVHWVRRCQMIVTPTGPEEICIALFTTDPHLRIDGALAQFPEPARRLLGARPTSTEYGALTALSRARAVVHGNVALVGDAACSIDGVAGQGLSLAFRGAVQLANALAREDLSLYEAAHRELTTMPVNMTRLLLLMARYPWIRRKTLRMFAAKPAFFSKMMSVHAGTSGADALGLQELFGLGWKVLCA
jgi:2-polyprenyl-6-methoxyphenol hydroxylase-like FAD-dependent oxidoreductase